MRYKKIRSTKYEIRNNIECSKSKMLQAEKVLTIRILDLFRASIFEIRIY